ncbi:MAG: substrate-binding domain-containing protein [Proteobacteria bacterium]|nr:substrate-binding domain-containing protein [Pseudomonadota bacterium]MBU2227480.1 substrate-binding domain-containing protein [Pseudomonadota bacterium]MBU2262342.1 substrate-binding domain-containing protein [Pseudomonadota bacterium]
MKRHSRHLILIFTALMIGGSIVAGSASANPQEKLIITGSGSGIGAMRRMAEGFQRKHPNVSVDVLPSIGSTGGIKAVKEGKIDIGLSYRPLTPEERSMGIIEEPYGRTPLIFGVQESNPTKGVTLTEIEDIYAGKRRTWPDGTPIRLILRPWRDSFSVYLASINPRLKSVSEKAHSIPGVFVGMTDQEAAEQIEKTPGSFGITSACLVAVEKRKIKALLVDGVAPALSNIPDGVDISAGKYPYTMTMSLVYKGDADKGAVKDFIKFVFSKDGRKILSESGHVTLPQITGK